MSKNTDTAIVDNDPKVTDFVNPDAFNGEEEKESILDAYQSDKTFKYVDWDKLYIENGFNVRRESSYVMKELTALAENIKLVGLLKPLVVSKQPDGRMKVVQGHRRYKAMSLIRQDQAAMVEAGNMSRKDMAFARVLCDVKVDMKAADEVVLLIDHGNTKPLDKSEVFEAVKRLYNLGPKWQSEKKIQNHLGLTRGNMTNHWKMVQLPEDMQTAYQKTLANDPTADPKIGNVEVTALYKAYNEDLSAKPKRLGGGDGTDLRKAFNEIRREQKLSPSERKPSAKVALETAQKRVAMKPNGKYLVDFISHMLGEDEGIPALEDVVENICFALGEVFPTPEPEVTTVTEEGITREI